MPAISGALVLLVVSRRGTYLSPDALAYVGTARNLVAGNGYESPPGAPAVANFPPLYPLLLAGVGALGPDPLTVARFLNPLLFGASILLVGLLAHRITASVPLALAAQLLVVSGLDLLAYHSSALSEPLFLLLGLLTLMTLLACLPRPAPGLVVVAALLAAATCLTRYLGLVFVATGAVALVLLGARRRWASAFAFASVALAPLAGWLVWLAQAEGRASNRRAVLHLPGGDYFLDGLDTASAWIVPGSLPWPLRLLGGAVVVAALVLVGVRARAAADRPVRLFGLFAVAYVAALVADRSLFDVTGRLDDRFLLPLHVVVVLAAVAVVAKAGMSRSRAARTALGAVVGLQLAAGAWWISDAATDASVRPGGFAAPAWTESEVLDDIRALPAGTAVFTNQVDAVYFHSGVVARSLPAERALLTGEANPEYETQLEAMRDAVRRGGVLAYFTAAPARRVFLPPPAELAATLGLVPETRDRVGVLYRASGRQTA